MRGVQALGLAAMAALGCSSGGSHACPDVSGTYELTVTPTGQSENDLALCATTTAASVIDVVIAGDGDASVQGEACRVASTAGCEIEIACAGDGGDDATVSPVFVQLATFVLPPSGAQATSNALAELGAGYCAFEGTASRQP